MLAWAWGFTPLSAPRKGGGPSRAAGRCRARPIDDAVAGAGGQPIGVPRTALTLAELLLALAIAGVLLALALPPIAAAGDRAAVRAAARDIESAFAAARVEALARRSPVWVVLDSGARTLTLRGPGGTRVRALGSIYGVALRATRDSMSYDGRGLGWGAANLTVVVARGRARDTVVVSRLGRVRR